MEDLRRFQDLLLKWTPKINLISKSSIEAVWDRHILDSAQLVDFSKDAENWVDIGSGGGLPALVVAIHAKHSLPERCVTMVESDKRKGAFLRTAVRELGLNARVLTQRVEAVSPLNADVLSARALTDLTGLLTFAERHLHPGGTALFLKGETWEKEVQSARDSWSFSLNAHRSKTNEAAAILEIKEIMRV
ncbi:MAG: 16S rRNA (guanine(527)-N(7))-methyltransferase RsmG [Pseudomonadota bacterium]